jgi:UDP-N-acetylmuramoyl-tripeptide--D-alanyl-D-alanine ligase
LQVGKVHDAILAMGAYARARMRGTVIGVTGSAGKTSTVAMLGCALRPFGTVAATRNNGNLPTGVAWNLASSPWDSDHLVLELAIGRMAQSARLVRPDLAVFTNILPAHLEYHPDLPTIAARKSAIFEAMRPGAIVLLNRQMAERERVARAAELRGLRVLQYGTSDDCDAQLLAYDRLTGEVRARAGEREVTYRLAAAGDHMALNSLAALASAAALGHDLDLAAAALRGFEPLAGRGEEFALVFGSSEVLLIDESYNANPGSMTAALHLLASTPGRDRRIAVLGEMLNLGEQAADYHAQIARTIENLPIDRVHVLGELYRGAWDLIPRARRGSFARSREDLQAVLLAEARDGDAILIKGAHGSGLRALARGLRAAAARPVAGNLS